MLCTPSQSKVSTRGEDVFGCPVAAAAKRARPESGGAGPNAQSVHQLREPAGKRPAADYGAGAGGPRGAIRPAVELLARLVADLSDVFTATAPDDSVTSAHIEELV